MQTASNNFNHIRIVHQATRPTLAAIYLFRNALISVPNLSRTFYGSSSIYIAEISFWLSNIGLNYFLFHHGHLTMLPFKNRLIYSSFLSLIFTFGSTMISNHLNHFCGRTESSRFISSLIFSSVFLLIGGCYIDDMKNIRDQLEGQ